MRVGAAPAVSSAGLGAPPGTQKALGKCSRVSGSPRKGKDPAWGWALQDMLYSLGSARVSLRALAAEGRD